MEKLTEREILIQPRNSDIVLWEKSMRRVRKGFTEAVVFKLSQEAQERAHQKGKVVREGCSRQRERLVQRRRAYKQRG